MYRNQVNLVVALSFCFLNPMYALAICVILNFMESKINYRFFAIIFALSFAFYFSLRDWNELYFNANVELRNYIIAQNLYIKNGFKVYNAIYEYHYWMYNKSF